MTLGPESLPGAAVTDDRYLFRGLIRRGGDALGRDDDTGGQPHDTDDAGRSRDTDTIGLGRDPMGLGR